MRVDKYVTFNRKKPIFTDKNFIDDEEDDHKKVKIISNTQKDIKLDEVKDNSKIIHLKEKDIKDPYNLPDNVSKMNTKHKNDNKTFDMVFLGFEDDKPIIKKKIDNAYLYGEPSEKSLQLSNWQTEKGTSNPLNQRLKSIETGESLDDIHRVEKDIDSLVNMEVSNILNKLNEDKNDDLESVDKTIKDEGRKKRTIEMMKNVYNNAETEIKENKTGKRKHLKANIKPILEQERFDDAFEKNEEAFAKQKRKKAQREEKINKAASTIQDKFKKFKETKQKVKEDKENKAASTIQDKFKVFKEAKQKNKAATNIQKIVRGKLSKDKVETLKLGDSNIQQIEKIKERNDAANKAATNIQKVVRGKQGKKKANTQLVKSIIDDLIDEGFQTPIQAQASVTDTTSTPVKGHRVKGTMILDTPNKITLYENNVSILSSGSPLSDSDIKGVRTAIKLISDNQIKPGTLKNPVKLLEKLNQAKQIAALKTIQKKSPKK